MMATPTAPRLDIGRLATSLSDGDRRFRLSVEALSLTGGEVMAVTGASGSGKTLFLELLGLLRQPDAGAAYRVQAQGRGPQDLVALWRGGPRGADLARARGRIFGFVPQTGALVPFLSVAENVALTQRIAGRRDPGRVATLLDRLGIAGVARLKPQSLSIGQRQRVAIARALAHAPAFVIADEPTAALDPASSDSAMQLLLDTARAEGAGVILSSHDLGRLDRLGLSRLHFSVEAHGPSPARDIRATARVIPC